MPLMGTVEDVVTSVAKCVPAAPGYQVAAAYDDDSERGFFVHYTPIVAWSPIVAWRMDVLYPEPIAIEDHDDDGHFSKVVVCPDGQVIAQGETRWESTRAWLADLPRMLAEYHERRARCTQGREEAAE